MMALSLLSFMKIVCDIFDKIKLIQITLFTVRTVELEMWLISVANNCPMSAPYSYAGGCIHRTQNDTRYVENNVI